MSDACPKRNGRFVPLRLKLKGISNMASLCRSAWKSNHCPTESPNAPCSTGPHHRKTNCGGTTAKEQGMAMPPLLLRCDRSLDPSNKGCDQKPGPFSKSFAESPELPVGFDPRGTASPSLDSRPPSNCAASPVESGTTAPARRRVTGTSPEPSAAAAAALVLTCGTTSSVSNVTKKLRYPVVGR